MRLHFLFCAVFLTASACAQAQQAVLTPSAALACLQPKPGAPDKPEYPSAMYAAKNAADVEIELRFDGPDAAPSVDLPQRWQRDPFAEAVLAYAENLRVPCMEKDAAPVRLRQRYEFRPNDGRKIMPPLTQDLDDVLRAQGLRCMAHQRAGSLPEFPPMALRRGQTGNVLARLDFKDANSAPEIKILGAPGYPGFADAVSDYAAGLRMPCHPGPKVSIDIIYKFTLQTGRKSVLKDMPLRVLVSAASKMPQPVNFDLTTMACPFDVRITYLQPYSKNQVREIETQHPARKPLLDWLAEIQLELPATMAKDVFTDVFTLSVPCGRVEL